MNKFLTGGLVVGLIVSVIYMATTEPPATTTINAVPATTLIPAAPPPNPPPAAPVSIRRKATYYYFTAGFCAACRTQKRIFPLLSLEFRKVDFHEVDVEDPKNAELLAVYSIKLLPTHVVVEYNSEGKPERVRKQVGAMSRVDLKKFLEGG